MPLSDYVLFQLAKNWPTPMARQAHELGAEPNDDTYHFAYANREFDRNVRKGLTRAVTGLDVLEIGSGHGGTSCFMAVVGARSVVGIDLNTRELEAARQFAKTIDERFGPGFSLPVRFMEMDANRMTFPDGTFDLVLADNVFEHFSDPEGVMRESFRVLRPGGGLLVAVFSSIFSKYGLHLKHGLKLPWANLLFSEGTIIRAMKRLAATDPNLFTLYPGLSDSPQRVRDLRPYKDLNDITHADFKAMATRTGFRIATFSIHSTLVGKLASRVPLLRSTLLTDIFSTGAAAYLQKERT